MTKRMVRVRVDYLTWQYLNKFQERHRQKVLRRYLMQGAYDTAIAYLKEHPAAEKEELDPVIHRRLSKLRSYAEKGPAAKDNLFDFPRYLTSLELPDNHIEALKSIFQAHTENRRPQLAKIAREVGVSRRTLYRWREQWDAIPRLKHSLADAEATLPERQILARIIGKANYDDTQMDPDRYPFYGLSMRFDHRKARL